MAGLWRYRAGDCRIVCDIEGDALLVLDSCWGVRADVRLINADNLYVKPALYRCVKNFLHVFHWCT